MDLLNWNVINATVLSGDLTLDNISFNNYWLQNTKIITEWEWFWLRDYPWVRIDLTDSPQSNWQILNDVFFWGRTININWILVAEDKDSLDDLIDEFKLKVSFPNKLLKWKVKWKQRQLLATVSNLSFWTKTEIYVPFNLTFTSQDSFWYEKDLNSFLLENVSDNNIVEDVTINYKETYPLFIIWIKTWSITSLEIKNNGIWLTINETINAWDVIYIDWLNSQILINGVDSDSTWIFPLFENWSNNLTIDIIWTYTADISVIYRNNFV